MAQIDVFAFDQPAVPDKGVFGIGFAIGELADGGPARNPLLNLSYNGAGLSQGYIASAGGIDVGLTSANTNGFAFVALERDASGNWIKPLGRRSRASTCERKRS